MRAIIWILVFLLSLLFWYIIYSDMDIINIPETPREKFDVTTFVTQSKMCEIANSKTDPLRLFVSSKLLEINSPYVSIEDKAKASIQTSLRIQAAYN